MAIRDNLAGMVADLSPAGASRGPTLAAPVLRRRWNDSGRPRRFEIGVMPAEAVDPV